MYNYDILESLLYSSSNLLSYIFSVKKFLPVLNTNNNLYFDKIDTRNL